jgi:hypothetical protein
MLLVDDGSTSISAAEVRALFKSLKAQYDSLIAQSVKQSENHNAALNLLNTTLQEVKADLRTIHKSFDKIEEATEYHTAFDFLSHPFCVRSCSSWLSALFPASSAPTKPSASCLATPSLAAPVSLSPPSTHTSSAGLKASDPPVASTGLRRRHVGEGDPSS